MLLPWEKRSTSLLPDQYLWRHSNHKHVRHETAQIFTFCIELVLGRCTEGIYISHFGCFSHNSYEFCSLFIDLSMQYGPFSKHLWYKVWEIAVDILHSRQLPSNESFQDKMPKAQERSLWLSSRCMTNYMKMYPFPYAHFTETKEGVNNLFKKLNMMKHLYI